MLTEIAVIKLWPCISKCRMQKNLNLSGKVKDNDLTFGVDLELMTCVVQGDINLIKKGGVSMYASIKYTDITNSECIGIQRKGSFMIVRNGNVLIFDTSSIVAAIEKAINQSVILETSELSVWERLDSVMDEIPNRTKNDFNNAGKIFIDIEDHNERRRLAIKYEISYSAMRSNKVRQYCRKIIEIGNSILKAPQLSNAIGLIALILGIYQMVTKTIKRVSMKKFNVGLSGFIGTFLFRSEIKYTWDFKELNVEKWKAFVIISIRKINYLNHNKRLQ